MPVTGPAVGDRAASRPDRQALLRGAVRRMREYQPVATAEQVAARYGLAPERVVKLDANENPYGPSPRTVAALATLRNVERYPAAYQSELAVALGGYAGVPPDRLVVGSGSDELLDLVTRAVIEPGDRVVTAGPTFDMYRFYGELAGGEVLDITRDAVFDIQWSQLQAAAEEAKLLFLAAPNNPTGNGLDQGQLEELLRQNCLVVVDEAYYEFSGQTAVGLCARHDNLVVLRSLSKWAGLAGLRIGYGILPPWLAAAVMKIKTPYTVGVAATVATLATLQDLEERGEKIARLTEERGRLHETLGTTRLLLPFPSEANFLLCRVESAAATTVQEGLARRGIFVRRFSHEAIAHCLRISVGLPEHTDALLAAVREIEDEIPSPSGRG